MAIFAGPQGQAERMVENSPAQFEGQPVYHLRPQQRGKRSEYSGEQGGSEQDPEDELQAGDTLERQHAIDQCLKHEWLHETDQSHSSRYNHQFHNKPCIATC